MRKFAWRFFQIVLMAVTFIGIVKAVFVSLDIDESYAIAQAYRLCVGDKLVYDMWEPHQFSAFFPAVFLFPFVKLSGGTEYCVIFLRIIGVLLHFGVGAYLYHISKEEFGKKGAFLLFLLHMNFLPKWISMPEFELMHYWCMMMIFMLLYEHEKKGKHIYGLLAGAFFLVSCLCYPTMIFLLPVYLLVLRKGTFPNKGVLLFFLGAFVPAAATSGRILMYMSSGEVRKFVGYIFMDASHTGEKTDLKWYIYLMEFLQQNLAFAIALGIAAVITLVLALIVKKVSKKSMGFGKIAVTAVFICATLLSAYTVFGYLFGDENQFFFQVRILVCTVAFFVIGLVNRKEFRSEFWYGIFPAVISLFAVLVITNMDTNTSYAKLMPAVITGFFMMGKYFFKRKEEMDLAAKVEKGAVLSAGAGLLICILICKVILIRVSGCLPVTIKASLDTVEFGPAKGVYVLKDLADSWNDNYEVMENFVKPKRNTLYIGAEQLFYVAFTDRICTPSVQGTAVYNEMYREYYKEFPEKTPQIIVVDNTFEETPGYYYSPDNYFIFQWIENNLEIEGKEQIGNYTVMWTK